VATESHRVEPEREPGRRSLSGVTLVVRAAQAAEVRLLQAAVLRPDGPLPGDQPPPPEALHVVALQDGVVVGAATILPAPWPGPGRTPEPAWRLRGMVTAPGARRSGIGRAVLEQAVTLAVGRGAGSLWAEARGSALGFYRRLGWAVVGAEWIKPGAGPHRYIHLDLTGPAVHQRPDVNPQ
jgi:GNAT superfamily N-acetyltransferase